MTEPKKNESDSENDEDQAAGEQPLADEQVEGVVGGVRGGLGSGPLPGGGGTPGGGGG